MTRTPASPHRQLLAPAIVAAVVLGVAATTFVIDVVAVQTSHHALIWPYQSLARELRTSTWSGGVVAIASAVAAAGLLLLVTALKPAPRSHLVLQTEEPTDAAHTSPRSVRRALRHAAIGVEGVDQAQVTLRRHRVQVAVSSPFRDHAGIEQPVHLAVEARLDQLGLTDPPPIEVTVNQHETGR